MISFRRVLAVSSYEFRWDIRKVRILAIIIFSVALVLTVGLVAPKTAGINNLGIKSNLWWIGSINDVVVSFVSGIFPLIISVIISADSISWEFDKGTISSLFSQPVTRTEVYVGKFLEKVFVVLLISLLVTVSAIISSTISVGGQTSLSWAPIVFLLFALLTLSMVSVSFFLGTIVKSSGLMVGLLFVFFFAFVIGTILTASYNGFNMAMTFAPFFNTALVFQALSQYVINPAGTTKIPITFSSKSSSALVSTSNLFSFVVIGLIVDLAIFLVIGYILFRRSQIKG